MDYHNFLKELPVFICRHQRCAGQQFRSQPSPGRTEGLMKKQLKKIKRFYDLYTTGLNHREIEQLLQKDTVEAFSYLKGNRDQPGPTPYFGARSFIFAVKEIFLGFLMKLTPARRLAYGIALLLFVRGLIGIDKSYFILIFCRA